LRQLSYGFTAFLRGASATGMPPIGMPALLWPLWAADGPAKQMIFLVKKSLFAG